MAQMFGKLRRIPKYMRFIIFVGMIIVLSLQGRFYLISIMDSRGASFKWILSAVSLSNEIDTQTTTFEDQTLKLPQCQSPPTNLIGSISVFNQSLPWPEIECKHASVQTGGLWRPHNCTSQHRVALVLPYRDRREHLGIFLDHMHPFLQKQLIQYGIYIVEQDLQFPFNRGMLFNIGYKEAMDDAKYDCVIFHDVDLLPQNDFNLYSCPEKPRHMSVAIDKFKYKQLGKRIFGGAVAFKKEHFELVNGFSNYYFGWGGEDDDLYKRVIHHGLNVTRYNSSIARYTMLGHSQNQRNPQRFQLLKKSEDHFHTDGLNSLAYERERFVHLKLYTYISVKINQTSIMDTAKEILMIVSNEEKVISQNASMRPVQPDQRIKRKRKTREIRKMTVDE